METLTVTPYVMLFEMLAPANSLVQAFVSSFNNYLRELFISVTLDPVYCNAQVSIDFPVLGLASCALIIGSKPLLVDILS